MKKTVIVIGAGLGGMSAAIALAMRGFGVTVFEKNAQVGGKLNVLRDHGFSFDLGPSILTLPHVFRPLFEDGGRTLDDYVTLRRVDPQWRNFFEDGTVLDLWENHERMRDDLEHLAPGTHAQYVRFLEYARQQYHEVERGYFNEGLDTFMDFVRFYGLSSTGMDFRHTMASGIAKRVTEPHLRDTLEYFIKYVGSSAYDAPGFMNLMPTIQTDYGLWYVDGGLYRLAEAFERRMAELGIELVLDADVTRINRDGRNVTGVDVRVGNGTTRTVSADAVVSNMEVIPAHKDLLDEPDSSRTMRRLKKFEPACSGIVLHLGVDRVYPQLAHHNFFYARNQKDHFHRVFHDGLLPDDPTIYLVAPTRTDPSQAPAGYDNIKILPHIPHLGTRQPYTHADCVRLKDVVIDKLERMGLTDLRKHIVVEDFWTPFDIQRMYRSNQGSIYGVVSDRRKNFAFKAPKRSTSYRNLYFAGGSVNPGGGMPMVVLSGRHVARMIARDFVA